MSEIQQLSLEKAACEYVKESGTDLPNITADHFKAGANWQKEQLKAHMQKVIDTLENDFSKQLVANVTNILFS